MRYFIYALVVLILSGAAACEQETRPNLAIAEMELPHWTLQTFEKPEFRKKYIFDTKINPFCVNLDIDGNNTLDFAAVVLERSSGRRGIVILKYKSDSLHIFGAGNKKTIGGTNWNWLIGWKAEERLKAGADEPKNVGNVLILFTDRGTANWLYWDGKEWEWVAQ